MISSSNRMRKAIGPDNIGQLQLGGGMDGHGEGENDIDAHGNSNSSAVSDAPQILATSFHEMSPPSPMRMEFGDQNKSSSAKRLFPMVPPFPLRMSRVQYSDILPMEANEQFKNVHGNKNDCCLFRKWHTN
ncbi:hypothetical protein niasHT_014742 [Heterodera trifolii]|uniref:Uncharacterized protein n=1 Tax=Heterodera trifolii TaxID=157864 RepID=A0ABD2L6D7_9BILA